MLCMVKKEKTIFKNLLPYLILFPLLSLLIIFFFLRPNVLERHTQLLLNYPTLEGPSNSCDREICVTLIDEINKAKNSIDFAVYGFRQQDAILAALKNAKDRGVTVRGVVDMDKNNENSYEDTMEYISELGNVKSDYLFDLHKSKEPESYYEPKCDRPEGTKGPVSCFSATNGTQIITTSQASKEKIDSDYIMHNKFFIFDNSTVWTGSANISDTCTGGYNANVALLIKDGDVASWYKDEFSQMYESNLFHTKKIEAPFTKDYEDESGISVYFSPTEDFFSKTIIEKINNSKKRINISIFFLTHKEVTQALINAHERGVKIRIIVDATGAANEYSKHQILRSVGIEVKVEDFGGKMHAKAASFDNKDLIVGSTNWTGAGEETNDENMIILEKAPAYVRQYNRWFNKLWRDIPDEFLNKRPLPESSLSGNSCSDGTDNDYNGYKDDSDFSCNPKTNAYIVDPNPITTTFAYPINKDDCPTAFPIKGNENSYIYHLPTDEYYEKTDPEMCFATEKDAKLAGFRRAWK